MNERIAVLKGISSKPKVLAWSVGIFVLVALVTLVLQQWPAGLLIAMVLGVVAYRNGEPIINTVHNLLLPSPVKITEVRSVPEYKQIDHEAQRTTALNDYLNFMGESDDDEDLTMPPMQELEAEAPSLRSLDKERSQTKTQKQDDSLASIRRFLIGGVDQRTIATRVYGDSSKESMAKLRSDISKLLEA